LLPLAPNQIKQLLLQLGRVGELVFGVIAICNLILPHPLAAFRQTGVTYTAYDHQSHDENSFSAPQSDSFLKLRTPSISGSIP